MLVLIHNVGQANKKAFFTSLFCAAIIRLEFAKIVRTHKKKKKHLNENYKSNLN